MNNIQRFHVSYFHGVACSQIIILSNYWPIILHGSGCLYNVILHFRRVKTYSLPFFFFEADL